MMVGWRSCAPGEAAGAPRRAISSAGAPSWTTNSIRAVSSTRTRRVSLGMVSLLEPLDRQLEQPHNEVRPFGS